MKRKLAAIDMRIQIGVVVVALGLLGFLGHMFVVSPQSASATKLQQQIDDEQAKVYTRRAQLKSGAHPPTIQVADLYRLTRAMPDRQDMPGIILTLSQVARAAGIKFDMIEPVFGQAPPSTDSSYTTYRTHLTFRGDFYGLSDFVYRLRSLVAVRDGKLVADGRLFNIDTLTFGTSPENFPKITAELYVQAYVYNGASGTASAPTTAPLTTPNTGTTPTTSTNPTDTGQPSASSATALGAS